MSNDKPTTLVESLTPATVSIYIPNRFSIWVLMALASFGNFPQRILPVPSGTAMGWIENRIEEWITQRIKARNQET